MNHSDLQDRLFLHQAMMWTVAEEISESENSEWTKMLHQFDVEAHNILHGALRSANAIQSLEQSARCSLDREEQLAFNELCMIIELLRNGCLDDDVNQRKSSVLALIRAPSPKPPDESWKLLPTMVEVDSSALDSTRYTYEASVKKLRMYGGDEHTHAAATLSCRESDGRCKIVDEEDLRRRRVFSQHNGIVSGLREIERTIEAEFRAAQTARMPVELRLAFHLWPLLSEESFTRRKLVMLEDEEVLRVAFELRCVELLVTQRENCDRKAADMLSHEAARRQAVMHSRRVDVHVRLRWKTWLKMCRRQQVLRRERAAAGERGTLLMIAQLRQFCCRWRDALMIPRQQAAQQLMLEEALLGCAAIVGREDEERHRNAVLFTEEAQRHNIEDAFLAEREAVRSSNRTRAAAALHSASLHIHRMSVVLRWFGVVRQRQLQRKTVWLHDVTCKRLQKEYIVKWMRCGPIVRTLRPLQQQLLTIGFCSAEAEKFLLREDEDRACIELQCDFQRDCCEDAFHSGLHRMCHRLQVERVQRLEQRNSIRHIARSLQAWLQVTMYRRPAVKAQILEKKTAVLHVQARWRCWMPKAQHVCLAKLQMHQDAAIARSDIAQSQEIAFADVTRKEKTERRYLQRVAIRQRKGSAALAQCVERLRVSLAVAERCQRDAVWSRWSKYRARRVRNRALSNTEIILLAQQQANTLRSAYLHTWVMWHDVHVERDAIQWACQKLPSDEQSLRQRVLCDEKAERKSLERQLESENKRLLLLGLSSQVESLRILHEQRTRRTYWCKWTAFARRTANRRKAERVVLERSCQATLQLWLRKWWAATIVARTSAALSRLREISERRLLSRYYLNLAPHSVRLARVSRAKASLERAQQAAKILAVGDMPVAPRAGPLPPLVSADRKS